MNKYILSVCCAIIIMLLHGCTPLPTGGAVSANVIYKTYNLTTPFTSDYNSFTVDLNNDGVYDLTFSSAFIPGSGGEGRYTAITPSANVDIAVSPPRQPGDSIYFPVKAFNTNEAINSTATWTPDSTNIILSGLFVSPYSTQLRLSADQTAFIGVRFRSGTDAHYAWIRIFVNPMLSGNAPVTTTLMESAYNKNVNQQILAGKK